ncbi:MAG TPA: DUF1016 N-terminal domain-containing protein [Tepidisphaeraceae bacterium]|nr:DUF1016 N-terminal domain-containing protein [Tepidisphaeraceae bacterium]
MKKKTHVTKRTVLMKSKPDDLGPLIAEVRGLIQSARRAAALTVNTLQVLTNFEIGRRIVEHEQKGTKRAAYGATLLNDLSAELTSEFGRGFSRSNLQNMRAFFIQYENRAPKICQQPIGKLDHPVDPRKGAEKSQMRQPSDQMSRRQLAFHL